MDKYSLEELQARLAVKRNEPKNPSDDQGQLTVDIYQTADEIVIQSTIAGADPNEIDVSITKDAVTIKGARKAEEKVESSGYYHQEIYWGDFSRSIILPVDINPDKSKASMKNGVLTIRLPKLVK